MRDPPSPGSGATSVGYVVPNRSAVWNRTWKAAAEPGSVTPTAAQVERWGNRGSCAYSGIGSHEDLLGFILAKSQIISAHLDLDRIAQGREPHQFDLCADK